MRPVHRQEHLTDMLLLQTVVQDVNFLHLLTDAAEPSRHTDTIANDARACLVVEVVLIVVRIQVAFAERQLAYLILTYKPNPCLSTGNLTYHAD